MAILPAARCRRHQAPSLEKRFESNERVTSRGEAVLPSAVATGRSAAAPKEARRRRPWTAWSGRASTGGATRSA